MIEFSCIIDENVFESAWWSVRVEKEVKIRCKSLSALWVEAYVVWSMISTDDLHFTSRQKWLYDCDQFVNLRICKKSKHIIDSSFMFQLLVKHMQCSSYSWSEQRFFNKAVYISGITWVKTWDRERSNLVQSVIFRRIEICWNDSSLLNDVDIY